MFLLDRLQMHTIIDIEEGAGPNGEAVAKLRGRGLVQAGVHVSQMGAMGQGQWWEAGIYENEFIKEGKEKEDGAGGWRIWKARWFESWEGSFEHG